MFILISLRFGAYLLLDSTYGSDITQARRFDETAATAFCARHYNNGFSEFGLVPIREEDLNKIRELAKS